MPNVYALAVAEDLLNLFVQVPFDADIAGPGGGHLVAEVKGESPQGTIIIIRPALAGEVPEVSHA